jgi:hypothetical protein
MIEAQMLRVPLVPLLEPLLAIAIVLATVGTLAATVVELGPARGTALFAGALTAILSGYVVLTISRVALQDEHGQVYMARLTSGRFARAAEVAVGMGSLVAGVTVALDCFRGFTYDDVLRVAFGALAVSGLVQTVFLLSNRELVRGYLETWQGSPTPRRRRAVEIDREGGFTFNWSPSLPFPGVATNGLLNPVRELFWRGAPPDWALRGLILRAIACAAFFGAAATVAAVGRGVLDVTGLPAHIVATIGIPAYCALLLARRIFR